MSDFKCVLIEDQRIADITAEEVFGVQSGPSQSTYQQFSAVTSTNSSIVFNIQVPSENIVIDRHVLLQSTVTFSVNLGNVPVGQQAFQYGLTDCLQAFPLNSLFTTTQATINNVSTSTNTQDVLPMLSRMNDKRMLSRYNSLTPSLVDSAWGNYSDAVLANNNPLAGYSTNSYDEDFVPRGAYPVSVTITHNIAGAGQDQSPISTSTADTWVVVITGTFTEPFLAMSPFLNCAPQNSAGLVGVNNMSFVLNVDQSCKRLFSTANTYLTNNGGVISNNSYITSITLGASGQAIGFTATKLLFNFLSLQPEQYAKISTKNIVPYLDYPRYLTTYTSQNILAPGASSSLTSQAIQLNQIPDLILISVRLPMGSQNWANPSSFLTINGITINFNNASGLLASATPQDLYNLSYRNGSAQSFYEFQGKSAIANNATGTTSIIPTTGSLLVLNPVMDFSLPSYLSSSSLGQYQLQFNVNVTNQYPYTITPEICICTINSGLFVTQQGTSQIFTGILTKDQVLQTKSENPVPHLDSGEYARLVGGKLQNRGMSALMKLVHHYKKHKRGMSSVMGAGTSGGGHSGGSKLKKHLM